MTDEHLTRGEVSKENQRVTAKNLNYLLRGQQKYPPIFILLFLRIKKAQLRKNISIYTGSVNSPIYAGLLKLF